MIDMSLSRRSFLQSGAAAGLAGMAGAKARPVMAATPADHGPVSMRATGRALVFIMLDGGNDSYNMLVPRNGEHYREYQNTRSNLALDQANLLPLEGYADADGRKFGLHHAMPEIQDLFHAGKLSFLANTAPMVEPVKKSAFYNGSARLPLGLLSHADQFRHWQSARPDLRVNRGWFGAFADSLQPGLADNRIPMNISLAGSNILQNGVESGHYSITGEGSTGLVVNEEKTPLNLAITNSFEKLLTTGYPDDPFRETWLGLTRKAQARHEIFRAATRDMHLRQSFPDTPLAQQLRMVAQSIAAADNLETPQQTFFLRYIGWDHHDELLGNHAHMLKILSQAMGAFQAALVELGVADKVITFTGSDFGRTLTSNGNGTDHGWGGNIMVMGDAIQGGQVFGHYPALGLGEDNPLDVGNGVLLPTTPVDSFHAELARWFGAADQDLVKLFPNLVNFDMNTVWLGLTA